MNIYEWAPRAARYRDPITGRFVSRATIREGVDSLIRASQQRISRASEQLRSRITDIGEWHAVMRDEIKMTQLVAEVLLRGGWKQMTRADYDRVGLRVREQFDFLQGFVDRLLSGEQITDGSFMNYARMYAAAARVGFQTGMAEQLLEAGYTEEHNVLHPAEHCVGCEAATARGWVPIMSNVPIGSRDCLGNDLCTMLYR